MSKKFQFDKSPAAKERITKFMQNIGKTGYLTPDSFNCLEKQDLVALIIMMSASERQKDEVLKESYIAKDRLERFEDYGEMAASDLAVFGLYMEIANQADIPDELMTDDLKAKWIDLEDFFHEEEMAKLAKELLKELQEELAKD